MPFPNLRPPTLRHVEALVDGRPVKGVSCVEFIGPCHINADIRLICTEGGPDPSSTFAEGNSRPPMLSQQEMGLAKLVVDHLNRESVSV